MKRRIKICSSIILLSGLLAFCAFAEGGQLWFNIGKDESGGYCVTLNVSEGTGVEMMQFTVHYDSQKLELVSCSVGDGFSGTTQPTINCTEGEIYFVWDALSPLDGANLLVMTFAIRPGSTGTAEIWCEQGEDFVFADESYSQIPMKISNGLITIDSTEEDVSSPGDLLQNNAMTEGEDRGIDLNQNRVELSSGSEITLETSTEEIICWTSSNESVAIVEDGKVIAVVAGMAVISAESEDGQKSATCVVNVEPAKRSGEDIANKARSLQKDNARGAPVIIMAIQADFIIALIIINLKRRAKVKSEEQTK